MDLKANVEHALSLGLREADDRQKRLHLVANGPSAASGPWRLHRPYADIMAINGALKLFTDRDEAPDYWICCDPQGPRPGIMEPARFLDVTPEETTYLVASKCHPSVFERLKGRDVRLWHVSDVPLPGKRQVPCAVSVTICALLLAQRLGYRRIDVWGWDCCYDGDRHHAGEGELGETPNRVEVQVGDDGEKFVSSPTWACEVTDASKVLPVLRWAGVDVKIHGRSLISAVLPEFSANQLN